MIRLVRLLRAAPALLIAGAAAIAAAAPSDTLVGAAAFGDWRGDRPGLRRLLRVQDLPPIHATGSSATDTGVVARPSGFLPKVPPGFSVSVFAEGLDTPRMIRVAPNGDIFVAESNAGRIELLRAPDGAPRAASVSVFASHLHSPFGMRLYPAGDAPQLLYVADTDALLRFPYALGETALRAAAPEHLVSFPTGGHRTRDLVFSPDGKTMYVSIGSGSNDAEGMATRPAAEIAAFERQRGLGAAWYEEERRADVLALDPDGRNERIFSTGIRNCVSLAIHPATGDLWCATNERDGFGDNLPPDYVTRVRAGAFYGWPWYYIGDHEDPNHKGERPDLAGKVTVPDVLLQAHSAPLGMAFYTGATFPAEYRGDGFVALQGSWNRARRTGNKIVRVVLKDGVPTGEYEDFMTGLVAGEDTVYGRPVAVAVAHDGALLVTDEAAGVVWRIAYGK